MMPQDIIGICQSIAYQIAQQCDHSDGLMFGLTEKEAEAVQTDPVLAVEKLVVCQLRGLAATGKRIVLLVDALDEAQERGTNRVVRLLKDLGKAKTKALSVVVTMRAEPATNMQILKAAYGSVLQMEPSELRELRDAGASQENHLAVAPEWAAKMQAMERSKIFVVICRGFVQAWLASRPATALPTPPTTVDAAYR
jgi:hypothetical protein